MTVKELFNLNNGDDDNRNKFSLLGYSRLRSVANIILRNVSFPVSKDKTIIEILIYEGMVKGKVFRSLIKRQTKKAGGGIAPRVLHLVPDGHE
jgi:hypothetical protein